MAIGAVIYIFFADKLFAKSSELTASLTPSSNQNSDFTTNPIQ
jgi:hypothetical protein